MGITSSTSQRGMREVEPAWVKMLQVVPEYLGDRMGAMSDGMSVTNANATAVVRHRAGHFHSDGAKWSRGFSSGKHAFEIYFPEACRGMEATVGVATESAPVLAKGKVPLVGSNKDSWGISLRTRRAFYRNAMVKKYPVTQIALPDKFYMYVDVDAGLLQFGSDYAFYGTALGGIPRDRPLYPMVSTMAPGANIILAYRGSALGGPGPVVVAGHVHQQQSPYGAPQQSTVVLNPSPGTTVITSTTVHPPDAAPYPGPPPPPPQYPPSPPPPAYSPEKVPPPSEEEQQAVKQ